MYCHDCWLFSSEINDWTEGFEPNTKNLARKIRRREKNRAASKIAYRWRTGNTIDTLSEKAINERVNFWREVLKRIVNIILTMAVLCLAFQGHRESVGEL